MPYPSWPFFSVWHSTDNISGNVCAKFKPIFQLDKRRAGQRRGSDEEHNGQIGLVERVEMVAIQTVSLKPTLLRRQNLYKKADVIVAVLKRMIIFV